MTAQDYIFSAVFVLLIFRQVRGRPLTAKSLLLPVAIVAIAADRYLHSFPTGGNNLTLVVACGAAGLALGLLSAQVTTIRPGPDGTPTARAGTFAILLWIIGTGSRLAFALYATSGGGATIAHFTHAHHITSRTAITTGLIIMALAEVIGRYGLLALRARTVNRRNH